MRIYHQWFKSINWNLNNKKTTSLFFFLFLFVTSSFAQVQVRNINSGSGSNPNDIVELNGYVYFSADDGSSGEELWRSDGTLTGTTIVADINTGFVGSAIANMVVMNGAIYFTAKDITNDVELWKSDGTAAGTVRVKDINVGGSSSPQELYVDNNTLYFSAFTSGSGRELWKSNGTSGGTVLVDDINPGSSGHSNPENIYAFNGEIYFEASNGSSGKELWKSDGTSGGTTLVQDIYSGFSNSDPDEFIEFGGDLYFAARDATNHRELWRLDGTTGTVAMVKDIYNGSFGSFPKEFFIYNSELYFVATDAAKGQEIWKTDGTSAGTVLAVDTKWGAVSSFPTNIHVMGTHFYYVAARNNGRELWKSDGTYGGSSMVMDINPSGDADISAIKEYNGRLFFNADNGVNGNEPWMTDGTTTTMLRDVNDDGSSPGPDSSPDNFIVANNILFFRANNGTDGFELMQIGNCDPNESLPFATAAGTHQSYYEKTDAGGWTHYCDCQNNLLVSVEKSASGVVIPTEAVSVKVDATAATFHDNGCVTGNCFITNSQGGVVFNRSWDVVPTTQPASDVSVRFYFTNAEYDAVNAELVNESLIALSSVSEMSFYKVTNGALGTHPVVEDVPAGDAVVLLNSSTASTTTWAAGTLNGENYAEMKVSSFSGGGGGGGSGGSALPVEMVYFKGRPQGENVYLEWSTATELNNAGFIIERSYDAEYWDAIDFVEGKGESAEVTIYKYVDKEPLVGISYYRLRQRDHDGTETYTGVVQVYMEVIMLSDLAPNPVVESGKVSVDINLDRSQDIEILLIDSNGSIARKERIELQSGVQRLEIDCHDLVRGLYNLRLTINKEAYHRNFIVESVK